MQHEVGIGLGGMGALRAAPLHHGDAERADIVAARGDRGHGPQHDGEGQHRAGHGPAPIPGSRERDAREPDGEHDTDRAQHPGDLPERRGRL